MAVDTAAARSDGRAAGLAPLVYVIAAAQIALHLFSNRLYGIFRDEFYYLACADHLAWGYVDHPPLSVLLLWIQRALLGDSVAALRVLPALAGAALVILAAMLARALGGGRFAQSLAGLAVAIVPQYLALTSFYSMNAFDLVFWAGGALLVVRLVETDDARLWLPLGAWLGLGLLNKVSVLFFGFGLAVGLLLTPLRRHLARPWPWLGGLIAALIVLPHVVWQIQSGWPTLEFIRNAQQFKIADFTPWRFFAEQFTEIHPLNAPIWLGGLFWLLAAREGRRFRVLGIIYVVALVIMAVQKSKPYYLGPAYPMLLAAGGVAAERVTARLPLLRPVALVVLALGGLLAAPFGMPLLPVETFIAYQRALGQRPGSDEKHELGPLPQHFADRFGWREMTDAVALVYGALPEEERAQAMIVTGNYGEAGALNYYGRGRELPQAVSQHNNFFLWGPGKGTGAVVITVGARCEELAEEFMSATEAARIEAPYAMPYETERPICVARGLKPPLAEAWARGKHYN